MAASDSKKVTTRNNRLYCPPEGFTTNKVIILTALPAGYRNTDGSFNNVGNNGNWWSGTPNEDSNAYNRNLNCDNDKVNRNDNNRTNGFAVRCVQHRSFR